MRVHALRPAAVIRHAAPVELPGSLADLYARVPAAEEDDLLEQHAVEQHQKWLLHEYAPWLDMDPPAPDLEQPDVEAQQDASPTHAQALGIVQHLLGARVLEAVEGHPGPRLSSAEGR